jgi:hypothetical protein
MALNLFLRTENGRPNVYLRCSCSMGKVVQILSSAYHILS